MVFLVKFTNNATCGNNLFIFVSKGGGWDRVVGILKSVKKSVSIEFFSTPFRKWREAYPKMHNFFNSKNFHKGGVPLFTNRFRKKGF